MSWEAGMMKKPQIKIKIKNPSRVFNKHIYDHLTDYDTFTEIHYGGASSGKSHGVIQKIVFKSLQPWKHPRKVLFLRKVGSSVYDSIFEDVKQCLETWGLLGACKVNNSAYRIELPNGAQFIFKGLDNPEKIKSIKGISDVIMEEASEFTLDDYTQLTLRLRDKKHPKKLLNKEELKQFPSYFGLDYGFINDPSAFMHIKIDDENRRLYIVEEYVRKGLTNDKIAEAIKALGYAKEIIRADSAEKKSNQELRNLDIPRVIDVMKGPGSVMQGIQYILQYEIIVDERCVKTIEELENYTWKKDRATNEYINEPVDSYNHCLDAMRYAIQDRIFQAKKELDVNKTISKVNRLFRR